VIGYRSDVIDLARFLDVRMIPSERSGSIDPDWKAR
jgi:ABC-type sulfate transport system substrate-binding protein